MKLASLLCALSFVPLVTVLGQDLTTWPSLSEAEQLKIFTEKSGYSQGHETFCDFMDRGDPSFLISIPISEARVFWGHQSRWM